MSYLCSITSLTSLFYSPVLMVSLVLLVTGPPALMLVQVNCEGVSLHGLSLTAFFYRSLSKFLARHMRG